MKTKQKNIFMLLVMSSFILFNSFSLFAYDKSMYIDSLNINVNISEDNQYSVNEKYKINYLTQHHGFFREIPTNYQKSGYYTKLKDITSDNPFSISNDDYSTIIKVGDAKTYVSGIKDYNIGFTLDIGKNYKEEEDGKTYFYYNLVGQYWDFPIYDVNFTINFPKQIDSNNISFTSGQYGSKESNVSYILSSDKKSIKGTIDQIFPGEALTLYVDLPKGYFTGERDYIADINKNFIFAVLVALLIIIIGIMSFIRYGKDEDIIEVQSFDPPKGFNPMMLSYFLNRRIDIKDTTAMLFYWADKGYINIKQDTEEKNKYFISKSKELPSSCNIAERKLFKAYFNNTKIGEEIDISSFGESFIELRQKGIDRVGEYFNIHDSTELINKDSKKAKNTIGIMASISLLIIAYFSPNTFDSNVLASTLILFGINTAFLIGLTITLSTLINNSVTSNKFAKFGFIVLSIIIILTFALFDLIFLGVASFNNVGYKFAILNIVSIILIAFLISITEKRSEYATKTYGTILGYKSFIEFVEIEKLKVMLDEDPNLFYHTLSFAIVLGLEKKWYKKFETLDIPKNNNFIFFGYSGYYYASAFNNLSSGINHSINQSISSVQASNNSGSSFSGGGFSGGGFGGGGGGGW